MKFTQAKLITLRDSKPQCRIFKFLIQNKEENGHQLSFLHQEKKFIRWDIFRISGLLALMQEQLLIISFFIPTFRAVDFLSCSWLQILVYFNIHVIWPTGAACVYDVFLSTEKVTCALSRNALAQLPRIDSIITRRTVLRCLTSRSTQFVYLSPDVNIWRLHKRVSYLQSREYINTLHGMKKRWIFMYEY